MRLDGCTALITGAGSGIGRALAVDLSRRGVRPILLGRNEAALEETRARLAQPSQAAVLVMDLADPRQRATISTRVGSVAEGLDLLVNNAGIVAAGAVSDQDDAVWRAMLEVNLLAPMAITRDLLPLLAVSGQGRVVNVGSMFGEIGFPFFSAYSASKFGLRGWSEALRRELAGSGVGLTYCAPRGTRTPAADGFSRYVQAFSMRLDAPEAVARRISDGIAADARDIYPPTAERLLLLVQRLLPRVIDGGLRRRVAAIDDSAAVRLPSVSPSKMT